VSPVSPVSPEAEEERKGKQRGEQAVRVNGEGGQQQVNGERVNGVSESGGGGPGAGAAETEQQKQQQQEKGQGKMVDGSEIQQQRVVVAT